MDSVTGELLTGSMQTASDYVLNQAAGGPGSQNALPEG